ncbi:uncharacterized protein [Diabrotica undecimpunctata]|uniref:uncharacterized protein n=1 Tax=Diabrotica undecimpunctata TaxID=50387 RepID=UPI003B640338
MNLLLKICLLIFSFSKLCNCEDSGQFLIHKIREDFLNLEDELWSIVLNETDKRGDDAMFLVKKFHEFDQEVQQLPQDILYGMQVLRKSEYFLLFFSDIRVIYDLYDKFRRSQKEFLAPDKEDEKVDELVEEYQKKISLLALVHDILSDEKNNVNTTILSIQSQIRQLLLDTDDIYDVCQYPHQSAQQIFYNFYNLVALTQLKAYMLSQFALLAHRTDDIGNFSDVSLLARNQYQEHSQYLFNEFKSKINYESRKLYRCDPKYNIEGKTYEQLTRLIQAHIQNEVDLNSRGTCTDNCAAYPHTRSYGCYDTNSDYCRYVQRCRGDIYNCRFIESNLITCDGEAGSHRRYTYIKYNGGRVLGKTGKKSCAKRTVKSWTRWFVRCHYCLCYCDEPGLDSDRYFSLRPSIADVNNNWVVTGMRFVKKNRMIHIQIQQGLLLPYGYIEQNSVSWKPVSDFSIQSWNANEGEDYHMMKYLKSTMNLDQLDVPNQNYVITGAKFVLNYKKEIQLQIQVTPFNFTSGILNRAKSRNIDNGYNHRTKIAMNNLNDPTFSPQSTNYYGLYDNDLFPRSVEFTHTDLNKDAAQTTIPFIDIQPVYSDVAVPLQSAYLYYKKSPSYGGFVGINLQTYDYSNLYNFNFPKHKNRNDDTRENLVELVH